MTKRKGIEKTAPSLNESPCIFPGEPFPGSADVPVGIKHLRHKESTISQKDDRTSSVPDSVVSTPEHLSADGDVSAPGIKHSCYGEGTISQKDTQTSSVQDSVVSTPEHLSADGDVSAPGIKRSHDKEIKIQKKTPEHQVSKTALFLHPNISLPTGTSALPGTKLQRKTSLAGILVVMSRILMVLGCSSLLLFVWRIVFRRGN